MAKELIKYPSVEHIDVVETDKMFVDVCRRFFPEVACGLEDERIPCFMMMVCDSYAENMMNMI